jgi:hypothetical protein
MSNVKLTNDQDKAAWLACLQAAASMYPAISAAEMPVDGFPHAEKLRARSATAAIEADFLFEEEYQRRCQ